MQEFREILTLSPVRLFRQDLLDLESVLKSDLNCGEDDYRVSTTVNHKTLSSNSIQSLLEHNLPEMTDRMHFEVRSRDEEKKIDAGISLSMVYNHVNCQLHALTESRFLGKREQIEQFFRRHRPWYAVITHSLPVLAASLAVASLFAAALMFGMRRYFPATLGGILLVLVSFVGWLGFRQKLFPYVRIYFRERRGWPSAYEVLVLILNIFLLIATILSIAAPLVLDSKQ